MRLSDSSDQEGYIQRYAPFVPASIIQAYLKEYLTQSTMMELENCTGVPARRLYDIVHGRQEKVSFPVADRILTGMDLALEWRENEVLARYYALAV